jgi:hypothetical protein
VKGTTDFTVIRQDGCDYSVIKIGNEEVARVKLGATGAPGMGVGGASSTVGARARSDGGAMRRFIQRRMEAARAALALK